LGKEWKSLSSSLCSFLHSLVTLCRNIYILIGLLARWIGRSLQGLYRTIQATSQDINGTVTYPPGWNYDSTRQNVRECKSGNSRKIIGSCCWMRGSNSHSAQALNT
jgi:hypothetical protein